jgi:hypothetical protein
MNARWRTRSGEGSNLPTERPLRGRSMASRGAQRVTASASSTRARGQTTSRPCCAFRFAWSGEAPSRCASTRSSPSGTDEPALERLATEHRLQRGDPAPELDRVDRGIRRRRGQWPRHRGGRRSGGGERSGRHAGLLGMVNRDGASFAARRRTSHGPPAGNLRAAIRPPVLRKSSARAQPNLSERTQAPCGLQQTVEGDTLHDVIARRTAGRRAEVLVVAPALNGRLRHWSSDSDAAREAAQQG